MVIADTSLYNLFNNASQGQTIRTFTGVESFVNPAAECDLFFNTNMWRNFETVLASTDIPTGDPFRLLFPNFKYPGSTYVGVQIKRPYSEGQASYPNMKIYSGYESRISDTKSRFNNNEFQNIPIIRNIHNAATSTLEFIPILIVKSDAVYLDTDSDVYRFNFNEFSVDDYNRPYFMAAGIKAFKPGVSTSVYRIDIDKYSFMFGISTDSSDLNFYKSLILTVIGAAPDPPDPYEGGGYSSSNEPETHFVLVDSNVPIPTKPQISVSDTGMVRMFNPTLSQLVTLSQYLWGGTSTPTALWNAIKQHFEDPMEAIISLVKVPVAVDNGEPVDFKILFIDTGVDLNPVTDAYKDVDCGTRTLQKYWDSALDFNPYTSVKLYLPFIGSVDLDTDEVIGKTIGVKYRVEVATGVCVAYVTIGDKVFYQFTGNCGIQVPLSSLSMDSYLGALKSAATLVGGVVVGSAAGISAATETKGKAGIIEELNAGATARGDVGVEYDKAEEFTKNWKHNISDMGTNASINNTAAAIMASKSQISHTGTISGASGAMSVRKPYLIVKRPRQCLPTTYKQLNGYPLMISVNLSNVHGYTEVQQISITGISCTVNELNEIYALLKSGVYL